MAPIPPELQPVLEYLVGNQEQTIAAAVAILGSLFNYQRTGRLPLGRMPWRYFRELLGDLGDQYFGVDRKKGVPGVVVDATPEQVMRQLRGRNYESTDLYSYEYTDEAWGLRRPSGTRPDPSTGEPAPTETHPRGFRTDDDRCLVICHDEASRFERPGAHLRETMLSWELGRDLVTDDLEALELAYEEVESEAATGVRVVAPTTTGQARA